MLTRWLVVFLAFIFGCTIVGMSLLSSATVFPTQSSSFVGSFVASTSASPLPGNVWYPIRAAKQKLLLYLMEDHRQPTERLRIAEERWQSAQQLVEIEQYDLAVSTFVKGHKYVAEAAASVQDFANDDPVKVAVISKLHDFRSQVEKIKHLLSDQQKVLVDQALAENEALLMHLGSQL